jgi:glucose/arabinose dehydrogenase
MREEEKTGKVVLRAAILSALTLVLLALAGTWTAAAGAMDLPPGFQARDLPLPAATSPNWTDGLLKPTTLDFSPDGKMFVAERNGFVLEFDSIDDPNPTLVLAITDKVLAAGDRGLLGMKLDPEYPEEPFIYLSYTYDAPIGGDSDDSTHVHNADGSDSCNEANFSIDCLASGRLTRVKVNPATSVAVGGAVDPSSEQVLVNSWCQQVTSHSIGDIEFDSSGALLMSGGDGASWGTIDYGQLGNPCKDPPYEGGSLRAQDLRTPATPGDPTDYSGSVIRVDRETGAALLDNPFSVNPLFGGGGEDVAARRVLANGLRNPYRFALRAGSDEIFVGDVGQDLWEEIDRFTLPPGPAANFGWPCYEGGPVGSLQMPRWKTAEGETHKPLCEALYTNPNSVKAPFFAYPHKNTPGYDGGLFAGDACKPQAGSAVAGLAFYEDEGVPSEDAFPAAYDGALFFSDAARGCLWTMTAGPGGVPDPSTVANFLVHEEGDPVFTPVDVVAGPDGALYVPNFYGDSIVQIRAKTVPTAELDIVEGSTYGATPLRVKFSAAASSDPNPGDTLAYAWDLDGDGQFDDGGEAEVEREYASPVNVTVRVRVSDDLDHSDVAEVPLYPGDLGPPEAEIELPEAGLEWAIGQPISYSGSAADPDGETLGSGPQSLTAHWEFTLQHCPSACHSHPITSSDSPGGSIVPPAHEYPAHLKLEFTAIDSRGMSDTETVEVFPRLIEVGVHSDPPGVPLSIEGISSDEPFARTLIAGGSVAVSARAPATLGGVPYAFEAWSDGGARSHEASSLESVDLIASYLPSLPGGAGGSPPPPEEQATARVTLASRPPGVPLRIGAVRKLAPFSLEYPLRVRTFILAPPQIQRGGRPLVFRRWIRDRRSLGKARRRQVAVAGKARYVGVYGPRAKTAGAAAPRPVGR